MRTIKVNKTPALTTLQGNPGRRIFYCQRVPLTWKLNINNPHNARINYIIAAWSGPRRGAAEKQIESAYFIKKHWISLINRDHSLSQITLAIADNPEEPKEFTNYIRGLPTKLKTADIKIFRRPNRGLSYGAFSDAFSKFSSFDYHIFVEDDYVFCKNHFDRILVQMFNISPHCGYLASYINKRSNAKPEDKPSIIIPNGISNRDTLQKIVDKYGKLPYAGNATLTVPYSSLPGMSFSSAFLDTGKWLYDFQSHYRVPFESDGEHKSIGRKILDPLLLPSQFC